uniref:Uncharacterized protein n=1 Tax=Arundo donax TaxID=35708 RepID=A0A0A9GGT3_ARUDO
MHFITLKLIHLGGIPKTTYEGPKTHVSCKQALNVTVQSPIFHLPLHWLSSRSRPENSLSLLRLLVSSALLLLMILAKSCIVQEVLRRILSVST